jgi:hypothetical protein
MRGGLARQPRNLESEGFQIVQSDGQFICPHGPGRTRQERAGTALPASSEPSARGPVSTQVVRHQARALDLRDMVPRGDFETRQLEAVLAYTNGHQ